MVTTTCFPPTAAARRYSSFRTPYLPSYVERKPAEQLHRESGCGGMAEREGEDGASQRKRIAVACGRCRKRKIRCSGDAGNGQPCQNCKNAGSEPCQFLRVSSQEVTHVKPSAFTYDVNASRIVQARSSSAASPICLPMTGLGDGLGLGDTHAASGRRAAEVSRGAVAATTGAEAEAGGGGTGGGGGGSPSTAYGSKQYYAATAWSNGTGTGTGAAGGGGVYDEDVGVDYAICSPSFATVTDEASPYRLTSHAATTTAARASGLMYIDAETTYGYGPVRPPAETGCLPYHHPSLAGAVTRPERLPGRAGPPTPYRTTDYRRSGDGLNGTGFHGYAANAAHLAFGGPETAGYALSDATAAFGGPGAMTATGTTSTTTDGDHHGQSFLFRPHDGCGSLAGEAEKGPEEGKSSARMRR
ncbi:hypothetical protein CDD80_6962 [Ophiocordyceps camponoti-rufipedis]|uniref:Zn(2)-C6 fungal-type domain-containing protein n=1 Tax=Ophiocordyceps camponoti-rufipedis TaxID=2004952 RepID=A0A2C5YQI6_9HYPO|nr:hypothetical protein CDD80_6962 [Ophiocordyceps camponoti-rufipedis]